MSGLGLLVLLLSLPLSCPADDAQAPLSSQIKLYVNGDLQATADCSDAWNATGHTVIGRGFFGGKPVDFANGVITDARVYDRALTAAQIETLHAQGPSPHWQFDRTTHAPSMAMGSAQGQLLGGAKWFAGQDHGSLSFDGADSSVDLRRSVLDTSRSYTVSAWVLLRSQDGYQTLISQDGKNISGFFLQKRDDNKFALSLRSADDTGSALAVAAPTFAPETNVLYHVVGVYQRSTVAPPVPPVPAVSRVPWDADRQGQFVQSLAQDHQGDTWVATEGQGVWRYDPAAPPDKRYTHFTTKEGLGGDDVYSLLVDARNRVWAGTLHGVSVYDGKEWKTYGPLEGVGGFRVFSLASSPVDGDVWIATEGGLTRYRLSQDRWKQYSRLDGLPSDAIQALAFSRKGDLFVGTQADGIAIASAKNDYHTWRTVSGPAQTPDAPGGAGLSVGLINCLLVARDGTVYAGMTAGLARSTDNGKTWRSLRGADWSDKEAGRHAQEWLDAALVDQADLRAIEVLPPKGLPVRIAAGGSGQGEWAADLEFKGGQTFHTSNPINTDGILNPAPQSVYQSARWGTFAYTVPHLQPGASCRVRLHLAEVAFDKPGQRVFNVAINGKRVLTHEDIRAEAGAINKVIVKEFVASADAQGRITISFRGSVPLFPSEGHTLYELSEDYVTTLAEDKAGHLLVGHRQQGVEVLDTQTGKRVYPGARDVRPTDFAASLLPRLDGTLLIGGYGGGLAQLSLFGAAGVSAVAGASRTSSAAPTLSLPAPAAPPTLPELNALLRVVSAVVPDKAELAPHVSALQDDWLTGGDWLGRYGRYWACVPACSSPSDYYWGAGWQPVDYVASVGPNRTPNDTLRYWVQTLYTDEAHCLELPPTYLDSRIKKGLTDGHLLRRDCSQDDHGETYPPALDGPNIYQTLSVPPGLYVMSLYFFNRQGGRLSDRDYRLSVRPHADGVSKGDNDSFSAAPEWAHGRVLQYHSGVWKRFLVRGPQLLTVQVNRNNSWNTELDGTMLDLVDEAPPPYFGTVDQWKEAQERKENLRQQALARGSLADFIPAATRAEAADRLADALDTAQSANSSWWAANGRRFYAPLLRWYAQAAEAQAPAHTQPSRRLATCYFQMGIYARWEESQQLLGLKSARSIEKALRWNAAGDVGGGYQAITQYLAGQHKVAVAQTEASREKIAERGISSGQHLASRASKL